MRTIRSSGGTPLAVHELGGRGRPTLLCHATGFHGAVWEPFARALPDDLERWAVDFRGHGASVVPPEHPLDWGGFRDDVLAVVDGIDLPPGRVLGVGHSMGGAALVLAEQARPGTFAGLWLFEPIVPPPGWLPGRDDPERPNPMADTAIRRRAEFPSAGAALANYASKPPLDRLRADALHAYVRHGFVPLTEDPAGPVRLACRPEDEARVFRGAPAHNGFARLGEVRCPVVIACGEEPAGPRSFVEPVVDALPEGRLHLFTGLGHFGPLEAPDLVAAAVADFAAGL
ncbi:MAG TPA: alpha/beta hydrolase [Acidimicrobiales bacterium]|nr:alpha/beta hydrolase [Acidimicrobiales bacterium]